MGSSSIASGVSRQAALVLAAAVSVELAISHGDVAVASAAGNNHAVVAKKKCKKKKRKKPAVAAKRCKKRRAVPVAVPPLPLTDPEVINRIGQMAGWYCQQDPECSGAYGYYHEPADQARALCSWRSTYTWACDGWYDRGSGIGSQTCDFREVVERDGYNGIRSHLDLSYTDGGFDCHLPI
jgi:hypothetical protein